MRCSRLCISVVVVIFMFLLSLGSSSFAREMGVPKTINLKGFLTNQADGKPVNGEVSMKFVLYDSETFIKWMEEQNVDVENGEYSVNLGERNPIQLPFDEQYYLGITVGDDEEMVPRQPFTSVPYALSPAHPITILNYDNYEDIQIEQEGLVFIDEVISLQGDYEGLGFPNLEVHGGGFEGSGNEEIEFGSRTLVTGTTFRNVKISGGDLTFVNCKFSGVIDFPSRPSLYSCRFESVDGTIGGHMTIDSSYIEYSTFRNSVRLSNSRVIRSEFRNGGIFTGNNISDALISLTMDNKVTGNICDRTTIHIQMDNYNRNLNISGNAFTFPYEEESEAIFIDGVSDQYFNCSISDNIFSMGGALQAIRVTVDSTANSSQYLKISGNSFNYSDSAIAYLGSIKTVVTDNVVMNCRLGVTDNGSYLRVLNNTEF